MARSEEGKSAPRIRPEASAAVGNTPIVLLDRLAEGLAAQVCAKLEYFNPGGSVKDRIGVAMIDAAEEAGLVKPGRSVVVEPTSGNTGIALAMVCAARGYELILTLPEGMSRERGEAAARLRGRGPRDALAGRDERGGRPGRGDPRAAQSLHADAVLQPRQRRGPPRAPRRRRSGATPTAQVGAFVAGVGTGGTITGVGRMLKERAPEALVVAVEPASSPVLSGGAPGPHKIQGIGAGFVPEVLDRSVIDEIVAVSDEDALETARLAAREEGDPGRDLGRGQHQGGARDRGAAGDGRQAGGDGRLRLGRALHVPTLLLTMSRLEEGWSREVRADVAAARDRDPAAQGVSSFEILSSWAGVQALLAHRAAHALLRSRGAGAAARDRLRDPRRDRGRDPSRRPRSARSSSSTTAPAW